MKLLDLFSGIGGFSLAAESLGIETVAFCEKDKFCQKVLKKNFPSVPVFPDICKLKRSDIDDSIDIITGGFPCQPFSIAGQKKGTEDDRDLWPQMLRIIKEFKPTWVVGENVANFISMAFKRTKTDLESEGYEVQPFIIPACGVGAPHRRDRVWILGYSKHNGSFTAKREKKFDKVENSDKEGEYQTIQSKGASNPRNNGILAYSDSNGRAKRDWANIRIDQTRKNTHRQGATNTSDVRCSSKVMADCDNEGLQRQRREYELVSKQKARHTTWRSGKEIRSGEVWLSEPNVGRVAHGISNRVDRLKCLGNAIVPQVAYQILEGINEIHNKKGKL